MMSHIAATYRADTSCIITILTMVKTIIAYPFDLRCAPTVLTKHNRLPFVVRLNHHDATIPQHKKYVKHKNTSQLK